jgi:hypothetical protein
VPDDSGEVANIVMYVDYLCPFCGQFEATNSESLRTMVESGAATLEVHPIAILTNKSAGTQYSLRAANAAACVRGLVARLVLRLQRDPLREPARGGLDRPDRTTSSSRSRRRSA